MREEMKCSEIFVDGVLEREWQDEVQNFDLNFHRELREPVSQVVIIAVIP